MTYLLKPNWKPRIHYFLAILMAPAIRTRLREHMPGLSLYGLTKIWSYKEETAQATKAHAIRIFSTYWRSRLYAQYIYIKIRMEMKMHNKILHYQMYRQWGNVHNGTGPMGDYMAITQGAREAKWPVHLTSKLNWYRQQIFRWQYAGALVCHNGGASSWKFIDYTIENTREMRSKTSRHKFKKRGTRNVPASDLSSGEEDPDLNYIFNIGGIAHHPHSNKPS